MFESIRDFFRGETSLKVDKDGTATDKDLYIATTVVLVEMACADNVFQPEELQTIVSVLVKEFDISEVDAGELLEIVQVLREDQDKISQFIDTLNECFNEQQRLSLLSMVWKVIMADEHTEEEEATFAADLRRRLNLSLEQAVRAQQMAAKKV